MDEGGVFKDKFVLGKISINLDILKEVFEFIFFAAIINDIMNKHLNINQHLFSGSISSSE